MSAPAAIFLPSAMAFILTIILVPPIRGICNRWRLYDLPGPLKIHTVPIPRLGGIAIAFAIAFSTAFSSFLHLSSIPAWPFFAPLALIWTASLVDDLRGLSPGVRIASQVAASVLLWREGWRLPLLGSGFLGAASLCLFVIIFVNAFNFLDGSDGLSASVAGVVAFAYLALPAGMSSQFGSAVAWSLLGACAGFLVFNSPPRAKIFMGETGSTALGFTVAFLALDFLRAASPAPQTLLFPFLVAALPILDAAFAVVRRLQSRNSPFLGDRFHFYDHLLSRDWSARKVLLACIGITIALSVMASICLRCSAAAAVCLAGLSVAALIVWIVRLGTLQSNEESPQTEESLS
jgi:UDP-GlcNAc:undecaprenyl-phosphate GlcNAc-1-phosphate transferase